MTGGRDPRNVLVAGAGGIGQLLGARLQQGGHQVTLLLRPEHAAAIRSDGLRVVGASQLHGHLDCITQPDQAKSRFDAILVTAKAHATAAVAAATAPLLAPDGIMVSLQNGFGNGAKIAASVPAARVAVGLTSHGVTVERPGLVRHTGTGTTVIGPYDASSSAAAARADALFSDAGLAPERHAEMRPYIWRKAIVNHAINPIAAAHGVANGRILEGPMWAQCSTLAGEAYGVARAAGVPLPGPAGPDALVDVVRQTLERTPTNRNSMLQDVAARKPTEIEQITGRIVRLSRRLGLPAFASEEAYQRVKAIEAGYLGDDESLRLTRDEVSWENGPF